MLQTKVVRENKNTQFVFTDFFFENCAVYEIMCKNVVQPDRPLMIIKYGACASHFG